MSLVVATTSGCFVDLVALHLNLKIHIPSVHQKLCNGFMNAVFASNSPVLIMLSFLVVRGHKIH